VRHGILFSNHRQSSVILTATAARNVEQRASRNVARGSRNFVSKDGNNMHKIFVATAFAALIAAAPAFAADDTAGNKSVSPQSSGPGVSGAPGNKNGPATNSDSDMKSMPDSGASGASSGEQGTQPTQDSRGVKGLPGNKSGPSMKPDAPDSSSPGSSSQ
jgi:hypothetical protein